MNNKKYIFIGLSIVILATGTLSVLEATNVTHFFTSAKDKQNQEQNAYNNARKNATIDNNGSPSPDGSNSKSSTPGTYVTPANSDNISLVANQTSTDQVVVTTKLAGYSDGTCKLDVSNGSKNTAQTAQVIFQAQFSTCAGFTVPTSTLGGGLWSISLSVTSGGITNAKSTTLEVK